MNARSLVLLVGLAGAAGLVLSGCNKIETASVENVKQKYDQVKAGMTVAEVKDILGAPDDMKTGGVSAVGVGVTDTTMTWKKGKQVIKVNFLNDKVVEKHMTEEESAK